MRLAPRISDWKISHAISPRLHEEFPFYGRPLHADDAGHRDGDRGSRRPVRSLNSYPAGAFGDGGGTCHPGRLRRFGSDCHRNSLRTGGLPARVPAGRCGPFDGAARPSINCAAHSARPGPG